MISVTCRLLAHDGVSKNMIAIPQEAHVTPDHLCSARTIYARA